MFKKATAQLNAGELLELVHEPAGECDTSYFKSPYPMYMGLVQYSLSSFHLHDSISVFNPFLNMVLLYPSYEGSV